MSVIGRMLLAVVVHAQRGHALREARERLADAEDAHELPAVAVRNLQRILCENIEACGDCKPSAHNHNPVVVLVLFD